MKAPKLVWKDSSGKKRELELKPGSIYVIGREPEGFDIYLYRIDEKWGTLEKKNLNVQDALVSRYDPKIGKFGSATIEVDETGGAYIRTSLNSKNPVEVNGKPIEQLPGYQLKGLKARKGLSFRVGYTDFNIE